MNRHLVHLVFAIGSLLSWRGRQITRDHIFALEDTSAATRWKRLGRRLQNENKPKGTYAFATVDLNDIEKKYEGHRDCLTEVIDRWVDMSAKHTVGQLYDVLLLEDLHRAAMEVFGEPPIQQN